MKETELAMDDSDLMVENIDISSSPQNLKMAVTFGRSEIDDSGHVVSSIVIDNEYVPLVLDESDSEDEAVGKCYICSYRVL